MSITGLLAQEDRVLREIRSALSALKTMDSTAPGRRGTVYASSPITTGRYVYDRMLDLEFTNIGEYRTAHPADFQKYVLDINLRRGARFGEEMRSHGYPRVIVPGEFFLRGWTQEHYMSLWRQVITRYARYVAFNDGWEWSTGCAEELLIAIQSGKTILDSDGTRYFVPNAIELLRRRVDEIDSMRLDAKPLYDLWRQISLTWEAMSPQKKIS